MNEQDQWTNNFCKKPVIAEDLYILPVKLLVKSYISSKNRKFPDIPWPWKLFSLEKVNHNRKNSYFTNAINTKTTPTDTNKKSGITKEDLADDIIYEYKLLTY